MSFRTRFSQPVDTGFECKGGLTDQAPLQECDLNSILKKYNATGVLPTPFPSSVEYQDLTNRPNDLLEAFEQLNAVREYFEALPSSVRETFHNDFREALQLAYSDPLKAVDLGVAGLVGKPKAIIESAPKSATPDASVQDEKSASPKGVEATPESSGQA